eukprot:TRINITY_DN12367_c0_g1_i1.p1 TRINITY_DN12367_c0_g1~~TRINITY_DN12367_c0_g1_i1.p1  ORF type:complete len:170 (+),score=7.02 TRINITY_DN12367_c0_g1_i1:326-835(+)
MFSYLCIIYSFLSACCCCLEKKTTVFGFLLFSLVLLPCPPLLALGLLRGGRNPPFFSSPFPPSLGYYYYLYLLLLIRPQSAYYLFTSIHCPAVRLCAVFVTLQRNSRARTRYRFLFFLFCFVSVVFFSRAPAAGVIHITHTQLKTVAPGLAKKVARGHAPSKGRSHTHN